jgi:hypothetical protein
MEFLDALAQTFSVTRFDAGLGLLVVLLALLAYYFLTLHQIFEAAFGAMVGLGIYVLLSVLLLGNTPIGSSGWLFPFGFSVFVVSIAIYLVFILAVLFPMHGWLVIAEPTHPTLYSILYFFTTIFFIVAMFATMIYMIDQAYIFKPGTIFNLLRDTLFYTDSIRPSMFYAFVIARQDVILPLGILLMLYKILLSNIVTAAMLSIWYNLTNVGFYKKKEDSSYRVEFHEVSWHGWWHDDHGHWSGHDAHAPAHDDHGHSGGHH